MDIYCGNLAYATTDDGLKAAFAAFGEVTSARVVTDRMTGRSKGFGFVEMPNRDQAQAAIDALNGQELDGRPIRVNESQPKPRRIWRAPRYPLVSANTLARSQTAKKRAFPGALFFVPRIWYNCPVLAPHPPGRPAIDRRTVAEMEGCARN